MHRSGRGGVWFGRTVELFTHDRTAGKRRKLHAVRWLSLLLVTEMLQSGLHAGGSLAIKAGIVPVGGGFCRWVLLVDKGISVTLEGT